MKLKVEQVTYVQCQCCGHIYQTADKVSAEESIVCTMCPRCGENVGLNCGDNKDDIYIFMNPNLDGRYFMY